MVPVLSPAVMALLSSPKPMEPPSCNAGQPEQEQSASSTPVLAHLQQMASLVTTGPTGAHPWCLGAPSVQTGHVNLSCQLKRKRHASGLEESLAKRLCLPEAPSAAVDADTLLHTELGPATCGHLVDMVVATLETLGGTMNIASRHRRAVLWTRIHQPEYCFNSQHLSAPAKALSLREQLLLQRGCTPSKPSLNSPFGKSPSALNSPSLVMAMSSPATTTPVPLALQPEPNEHHLEPLKLESSLEAPLSADASSPPASAEEQSLGGGPQSPAFAPAVPAGPSPAPSRASPSLSSVPLTGQSASKNAQMKVLLEKKLGMLRASFAKYKEKATAPIATLAQKQEALAKIKETGDAMTKTIQQIKALSAPKIPGLTLSSPSSRPKPAPKAAPPKAALASNSPATPHAGSDAVTSGPKDEIDQFWEKMDTDSIFK
mmetsp:Transcript_140780/g.245243  ORF Transcript_140780/g.245243 Transcript_140780/m.245243 type:complete len:431 (-) Transcript_140780:42-1334(-)